MFTFSTSIIIYPFSVLLSLTYRMTGICCSHIWIPLEASYSKLHNLLCLNPTLIPKQKQKYLLLIRRLVRTLVAFFNYSFSYAFLLPVRKRSKINRKKIPLIFPPLSYCDKKHNIRPILLRIFKV